MIEIHGTPLVAVQLQPAGNVTLTLSVRACAPTDALDGDSVALHAAPDWVSENVCPATVTVAVRDAAAGFAATL